MKLVVVKSNFQVLLVPNYSVFRITVKSCMVATDYLYKFPKICPDWLVVT